MASRVDRAAYWGRLSAGHLSEVASLVLEAGKALQMSQEQDNTVIDDSMVAASAQTLVESLSHITFLKLYLIT